MRGRRAVEVDAPRFVVPVEVVEVDAVVVVLLGGGFWPLLGFIPPPVDIR